MARSALWNEGMREGGVVGASPGRLVAAPSSGCAVFPDAHDAYLCAPPQLLATTHLSSCTTRRCKASSSSLRPSCSRASSVSRWARPK